MKVWDCKRLQVQLQKLMTHDWIRVTFITFEPYNKQAVPDLRSTASKSQGLGSTCYILATRVANRARAQPSS